MASGQTWVTAYHENIGCLCQQEGSLCSVRQMWATAVLTGKFTLDQNWEHSPNLWSCQQCLKH